MDADSVTGRSTSLAAGAPGTDPTGAFACVCAAWKAHEGELRGYLRHRMTDPGVADDVLQDVFVKAMRQGQGFCALDNPRAWLFQVARNAVVDRLRTAHDHEPLTDELVARTPLNAEPMAPIDALAECVLRTLGELPPEDAAIVRACDLEGQTQRAYARANGLSLPAAKSRLLRARQRLRDRLTRVCQVRFEPDGSVCGHAARAAP
ncbi:MAG: sigma-70 family RNA polymerase sigma factor [Rubrivivax sp.]|nr:sigma-70 family RNA polymerase sigma factor [Rubrivivax sp.]